MSGALAQALQPVPDEISAPYWEAIRRGKLTVQYDPASERYLWPPRGFLPGRLDGFPEWREVAGTGTVWTYSVVHRTSHAWPPAPYALAIVELDEGVRLTTRLVDVDLDAIEIGMRVRVVFEDVGDDLRLPVFTAAD